MNAEILANAYSDSIDFYRTIGSNMSRPSLPDLLSLEIAIHQLKIAIHQLKWEMSQLTITDKTAGKL